MFCSSLVYGSKGRSKDYLPGQYHYDALCRGQYHYNALVEREYEISSPLVSFDLRCESVTSMIITWLVFINPYMHYATILFQHIAASKHFHCNDATTSPIPVSSVHLIIVVLPT